VKAVWLGLDVAWDAYLGLGTLCFALAMMKHPRFGRLLGIPGVVVSLALLLLNLCLGGHPKPATDGHLKTGQLG